MKNFSIVTVGTYGASTTPKATGQHLDELIAGRTKIVEIGDSSMLSIRNTAGLSRHPLPILLPADHHTNSYKKNIIFLDTFGLNDSQTDFMYMAAVLTAIWEDENINESFNSVNRLASGLYVRWVADGYINQYGLEYTDADAVKTVAGLYYQLQGYQIDLNEFQDQDVYRVIRQVADSTGVPDKDVKKIIDKFDLIKDKQLIDFDWLIQAFKTVSDLLNVRMNHITALTLVSNSWFRGMAAQPQLALNYKPMFLAMLFTAFNDRSTARTQFDNMIKNTLEGKRRDQAEVFVSAMEAVVKAQVK